jgi:hypothetical protein
LLHTKKTFAKSHKKMGLSNNISSEKMTFQNDQSVKIADHWYKTAHQGQPLFRRMSV